MKRRSNLPASAPADWAPPDLLKQVSPDRAVITDDDRELCRACGELPATRGMYCRRCDDSITEDRLERESNR